MNSRSPNRLSEIGSIGSFESFAFHEVYVYDKNGNRTGIGYPRGVSATYGFDFADREVSLSVTSLGGTEPAVSTATYLPSGPLFSLALGSGATETRTFDQRYVPTAIGLSGLGAGGGDHTWS